MSTFTDHEAFRVAGRGKPPLRRLLAYARPFVGPFLITVVLGLLYSGTQAGRAYLMKPIFDDVLLPGAQIKSAETSLLYRLPGFESDEPALEATEAGYSVGTRNIVDVLEAERVVFSAIRDYKTARYTYIRNQIAFKESLGTLNPEDLQQLDSWLEKPSQN